MEVRFEGEQDITYGYTKDDLGFLRKQVVLPFNSQGTLAMARDEFDSNRCVCARIGLLGTSVPKILETHHVENLGKFCNVP